MKTISATNLRGQLRDILTGLDDGPVTITKHGKPVAVLAAPESPSDTPDEATTTADMPEPDEAPQSVSEATTGNFSEEEEDPGEWDDGLDDSFETYLSQNMPMDRPLL